MGRAKKESISMNARLDKAVVERLDKYCQESGVTKTFVIEKAVAMYLDKQEKVMKIAKKLTEE